MEAALAIRLPSVFVVGRCQMMRVKVFNGAAECRITVEGRLFSPWVSELESVWRQAQQAASGNKIVVDPRGMTFIGSNGEAVLTNVTGQGMKLVARGIYNEHTVQEPESKVPAAEAARNTGRGGSHGYHRNIRRNCSGGWSVCRSQEPGLFIRETA